MEDQSSVVLDPSGDLRLSTSAQTFVVSSKAMCLASPVWRTLFDPQGEQSAGVDVLPHCLPGDEPDALLRLLRIAHLQFSQLPDALVEYRHLLQLAVLCNKYDTVPLVRPWIAKWQAPLQAQAEGSRREGGAGYEDYETWMFIAWTFGDEAAFTKMSRSLVLTSTVTAVNGESRLVNAQGVMVGIMPPGSVDAIIDTREERISKLLEQCSKLVDRYKSTTPTSPGETTICTRARWPQECDSLVYGCLIQGLQSLKLFPERVKAPKIELSVTAFSDELRSLKCFTYPDKSRYADKFLHSCCDFTPAFAAQIEVIIGRKEPSGLLKTHLKHMDKQSK